jgi:hypothetical protein
MSRALLAMFAVLSLVIVACDGGEPPAPATLSSIHENIFVPRCGASVCHGGAGPARELDLVGAPFDMVGKPSVANPDILLVKAGDADNSLLYQVLQGPVDDVSTGGTLEQMPVGDELTAEELDQIKRWIDDGAKDN